MPDLNLGSILGGSLGQIFKDVVGTFKADPNKVLEMQQAIDTNQAALRQKELELEERIRQAEVDMVAAAQKSVQIEEASPDWFVRRPRSAFLWMIVTVMFFNFMVPIFLQKHGFSPVQVPNAVLALFAAAILGDYGDRSVQRLFGGAGGALQIPFLKANSSGDVLVK